MTTSDMGMVRRDQFERLKRQHQSTGGWQRRKSEITQLQLLEATVHCIVEKGFAQVRTVDIAKAAGLSRGAIMHHFANKGQLFEKTLVYIHQQRLAKYREAVEELPSEEARAERGLDIYWLQLKSHYFIAGQELVMAARSDPALTKILIPQRKRFRAEWERLTLDLFPEWSSTGPVFDLVMHITQFMMEGMVMNAWIDGPDINEEQLLGYLKARIKAIRDVSDEPGDDPAVRRFLTSS